MDAHGSSSVFVLKTATKRKVLRIFLVGGIPTPLKNMSQLG